MSQGYGDLSAILNLDPAEDVSYEAFLEEIEEFPVPKQLSSKVIQKLKNFAKDTLNLDISPEDRYHPTEEIINSLFSLHSILSEQIDYTWKERELDCHVWFITSAINGYLYGGIFVFWNSQYPDYVVIQGIAKFFIPGLFSILYPEYNNLLPKLNSLLLPHIEMVATNVEATKIYVAPVGIQGRILEQHYGFKRSSGFKYPCMMIKGQDSSRKFHTKEI